MDEKKIEVPESFAKNAAEAATALRGILSKDAETHKSLEQYAPLAADSLIAAGCLDTEKRASAVEAAFDHVKVLGTVIKLASVVTSLRSQIKSAATKTAETKSVEPAPLGKGAALSINKQASGDFSEVSAEKEFEMRMGLA